MRPVHGDAAGKPFYIEDTVKAGANTFQQRPVGSKQSHVLLPAADERNIRQGEDQPFPQHADSHCRAGTVQAAQQGKFHSAVPEIFGNLKILARRFIQDDVLAVLVDRNAAHMGRCRIRRLGKVIQKETGRRKFRRFARQGKRIQVCGRKLLCQPLVAHIQLKVPVRVKGH